MITQPKIGWIGLGKMGNPMSRNLLKAGYPMVVYDIVDSIMDEFAHLGVQGAESPAALAAETDIIVSMIPDDPALEDVCLGARGVFQGARNTAIYVDMSTVSPEISVRVGNAAGKNGVRYLRAPVSGSTESAANAGLTILASGPQDAFDQCHDLFHKLGQKVFHVGSGDEARYLKLLINIMVGITSAMTAEALTFGKRGGLDWNQMIDIINNSVVASPLIGFKVQLLKERVFDPMFTAAQMAKDFDLALDTGSAMDIPLPLTALTRQLYGAMKATGKGQLDYFGLVAVMEAMAGLEG